MTNRRRIRLMTPEDLALAEGIDNAEFGVTEIAAEFERSGLSFRPTTLTLMVQGAERPNQLGETIAVALTHRSPAWYLQDDPLGDFVVGVMPSDQERAVHLITIVPTSDYRWRRLERRTNSPRSGVSRFTLDLQQVQGLAERLGERGRVTVSRTTGRSVEDGSSISRGWSSDRPDFDQAFQELIRHPASVRTVTFWVGRSTNLQIRRDGGATLYRGSAVVFQDVVLDHLAAAAHVRAALLKDRQRPEDRPLDQALRVHFSSPPFISEGSTEDLSQILYLDSEFGVAVLHDNPYFHASVTDYAAAASADVFVTDSGEVTIFPGYNASMAFLSRIADRIAERFPFSHLSAVSAHPEFESSAVLAQD
jgi:hypothetical protein